MPSHHDNPAAQQRARGAAELSQQPRLGAAGVRRIAAEPLVMVARDQEPLVGQRSRDQAGDEFEAIGEPDIGIGRAGVANTPARWRPLLATPLDELRGLLDPAMVEHGAGMQETSQGERACRAPAARAAACDPSKCRKWQPATSATRSITPLPVRSEQQYHRAPHRPRRPAPGRRWVATAGCYDPLGGMITLNMRYKGSLFEGSKPPHCYHLVTTQISPPDAVFLRQRGVAWAASSRLRNSASFRRAMARNRGLFAGGK